MILIVDSGSTKCDWMPIDSDGNQIREKIRTKGLNPAILKWKKLNKIINKSDELIAFKNQVSHVFFYGAGEVEEDTLAAVRAAINSDEEAAVVCILGTGSNCSYYDGSKLHQRVKSLGYTVMDDASGNYFGKQLIRDYYFNHMPEDIKIAFEDKFNLDSDYIKLNLYKTPNPNAYLASFAEFMFLNKDSSYITKLIVKGIRLFANNMILQFKDELQSVPVHFAGSIAFFAEKEIRQVADELNFKVGNFVRRPIEGLVNYHLKHLQLQ